MFFFKVFTVGVKQTPVGRWNGKSQFPLFGPLPYNLTGSRTHSLWQVPQFAGRITAPLYTA